MIDGFGDSLIRLYKNKFFYADLNAFTPSYYSKSLLVKLKFIF